MQIKEREVTEIRKLGEENGWTFEAKGGRTWKATPPDRDIRAITFRETTDPRDALNIVRKFERAKLFVLPQYRNGGKPDKEPRKRNVLGIDPAPRETLTTTIAEATGTPPRTQKPLPTDLALPNWVKSARIVDHTRRRCNEDQVALLEVFAALADPDYTRLSDHDADGDRTIYYRGDVEVVFDRSTHAVVSVFAPAGPDGERRTPLGPLPDLPVRDATKEDVMLANQAAAEAAAAAEKTAEPKPGRAAPHVPTPVVMDRKRAKPDAATDVDPSELTGTAAVDYYMRELAMPGDVIDVAEVHKLLFPKSTWMSFRVAFFRRHQANPAALVWLEPGNRYRYEAPAVEQPPAITAPVAPLPATAPEEPVTPEPEPAIDESSGPTAVVRALVHKIERGGLVTLDEAHESAPWLTRGAVRSALDQAARDGTVRLAGSSTWQRLTEDEENALRTQTDPHAGPKEYAGMGGTEVAKHLYDRMKPGQSIQIGEFLAGFARERHGAIKQAIQQMAKPGKGLFVRVGSDRSGQYRKPRLPQAVPAQRTPTTPPPPPVAVRPAPVAAPAPPAPADVWAAPAAMPVTMVEPLPAQAPVRVSAPAPVVGIRALARQKLIDTLTDKLVAGDGDPEKLVALIDAQIDKLDPEQVAA